MKNLKKKGFTIVELVIVIAVIAILSAVLIPTFSSLIRKANISSDTVLSKNLNTALKIAEVENGVNSFDEALEAIKENGYLIANLNAKTNGCFFVWESKTNQILLVDSKNNYEVLFSLEEYEPMGETWYFAISNKEIANQVETDLAEKNVKIKQTVASEDDLKGWITSGGTQTIYIDESIDVNSQEQIEVNGGEITIKLSGSTISGNRNDGYSMENVPFYVKSGILNIEGGVINATGSYLDADGVPVASAFVAHGGKLNLTDTTIDGDGKVILVSYENGSTGKLVNTKVLAQNTAIGVYGGSNVEFKDCIVGVDLAAAIFVSNYGGVSNATILSGKYSALGNTIYSHGGKITIEGGEFSAVQTNIFKLAEPGSTIIINGGTFTAAGTTYTFDQLDENIIRSLVSTADVFDVEKVGNSFVISRE